MGLVQTSIEIEYPETDGKPMGETDLHREYERIESNEAGAIECEELGFTLQLEERRLVMHDSKTGELLLTEAEAAKAQVAELQQELEILREQLRRGT